MSWKRSNQERNAVRWRLELETKLAPPCSNLRSFGSKCAVKVSTCDIVVTFRRPPQSFGAPMVIRRPGNCAPPSPPRYAPGSNPSCNGNRRDKVALRTTCNRNIKFKIIRVRTSCQYVWYFYYSKKPKLGRTKPWTGQRIGNSWSRV